MVIIAGSCLKFFDSIILIVIGWLLLAGGIIVMFIGWRRYASIALLKEFLQL